MSSDSCTFSCDWIAIEGALDVVVARNKVREIGGRLGLPHTAVEALATATSEIASNIVVHARSGELKVQGTPNGRGVEVVARDRGPGIPDPVLALEDGYSTANTLGLGLPSAKRLVDEFWIEPRPGGGTFVVLRKWCR